MPTAATFILHSTLSLISSVIGIYVLLERKMIVAGKLTGHVYQLEPPAHIVMAISFFILSAFFIIALTQNKTIRKTGPWLFIAYLVLFSVSLYL